MRVRPTRSRAPLLLRLTGFALTLTFPIFGCRRPVPEEDGREKARPGASPKFQVPTTERAATSVAPDTRSVAPSPLLGPPEAILKLEYSAYRARVSLSGPTLVVATDEALYRLTLGRPMVKQAFHPAAQVALGNGRVLSWSEGWFYHTKEGATHPDRWFREPEEPASLISVGADPVWLVNDPSGEHRLRARIRGKTNTLYASPRVFSAGSEKGNIVYFVEALGDGTYRFVSVPIEGGAPAFSAPRRGRPPAMLVPSDDALVYYAGLEGGVRSISPDFTREVTLKPDWICSPLAVFGRTVYCASVDGVGVIPEGDTSPVWHPFKLPGPITALAASETHLAIVVDSGKDQLTLEIAPVLPRGTGGPADP